MRGWSRPPPTPTQLFLHLQGKGAPGGKGHSLGTHSLLSTRERHKQASAGPCWPSCLPYSTVLKSTFPLKTEEQIQELMEAGGWHPSSSNADLLNYRSLFMEVGMWVWELAWPLPQPWLDPGQYALPLTCGPSQDEEGQSEPFVQKLWEQYMDEKDEYLLQLKQELGIEL